MDIKSENICDFLVYKALYKCNYINRKAFSENGITEDKGIKMPIHITIASCNFKITGYKCN